MHRLQDLLQEHSDHNEKKLVVSRNDTWDLQLSHLPNFLIFWLLPSRIYFPESENITILWHNHHTLPYQEETDELLYPRVEQHN